jgi:bla regulator protein BlaR1
MEVIMKKKDKYFKVVYWAAVCAFILTGCSDNRGTDEKIFMENEKEELEEEKMEEPEVESSSVSIETDTEDSIDSIVMEPEIAYADWSEYSNGLNGAAVVYDATNRQYTMYNADLALARSSPCSTFKIISSLIALENGITTPEDSTREWSGEIFWNEDWNKDIDFYEAFRTSCVWYYRQVIDDIGKDMMQKELDKLQYGNCDISDWEGRLNTNNNNRALTGFWIESSLMISPKEQVDVMERIFSENSDYSEETQNELKQVMLVPEQDSSDISIYGKTGMGKAEGVVVDAWFTGFAESTEGKIYFCVHLGRTDGMDVSSPLAKEIAIQIVSDYYGR